MEPRTIRALVPIILLICCVSAQGETKDKSSTDTTATASDSGQTATTLSPTTIITTTTGSTDPTTPPDPTTTTPTATTTTAALAVIGADCGSEAANWCNSSITGEASCQNDLCACVEGHFQVSPDTCEPVSNLVPSITFGSRGPTSIHVNWALTTQLPTANLSISVEVIAPPEAMGRVCTVVNNNAGCMGLTPGTVYTVQVKVTYGEHSGNSTFETYTEPAQPGVYNVTQTSTSAELTWLPSQGGVDYYIATLKEADQSPNVTRENLTFINLTPATIYAFDIVAYRFDEKSTKREGSFRTLADIPGPPTDLMVTTQGSTTVRLGWTAPAVANGTIHFYEVCRQYKVYSNSDVTPISCVNTTGNQTMYDDAGLVSGAFYTFQVYTVNEMFKSDASEEGHARTHEAAPGRVNITISPGSTSLFVAWSRPEAPNGDILAYRLEWMEKEQATECIVLLKSENYTGPTNFSCSTNSSGGTVGVNQETMNYNITNLKPYTPYTIQVVAYTSVGWGALASKDQETSVAIPDAPTGVMAESTGNSTLRVSFTLPTDNRGPVTFTVIVKDMITHGNTQFNYTGNCSNVISVNDTRCEVEGLEEFWVYTVQVRATTAAGHNISDPTGNITTDPGRPGMVSNITTRNTEGTCDATSSVIFWYEPQLKERNSRITYYHVDYQEHNLLNFPVSNPQPYAPTANQFKWTLRQKLVADTVRNYTLYGISEGNVYGVPKTFQITTGVCPPPGWDRSAHGDIKSTDATTASVTISFKTAFLTNNDQGSITEKGVVVSMSKQKVDTATIGNLNTWQSAKKTSFANPYKVRIQDLTRTRRSIPETFVLKVGANSSCTEKTDATDFCNGPLPENFQFYVAVYACTRVGCTKSPTYGPYVTNTTKPEDDVNSKWLAPVIILALLLVCLIIVLGLMYFRGYNPREWFSRKETPALAPPFTPGEMESPIIEIPRKRPMSLSNYDDVLQDLHKDTNLLFSDQYGDIGKLSDQVNQRSSFDAANMEANKAKNRWVNILPYDHSRVKLQQLDEDDPSSDYINANYIPGFHNKREYIATQGPLPGTVDDFWRMVWEHNVQVIVMLTQLKEGNRVKCEKYWPDEVHEPKQYGDIVVDPTSISSLNKFNITIFEISMNNQSRQVIHFHYLHFPDFSANVEFDVFIDFVQTVRGHVPHDMVGPMVVHCSAGVGRTGTFVAVDRLDQMIRSSDFTFDQTADIFDIVMSMRDNRVLMVQTESQFIMIHDCLKLLLDAKKRSMEQSDSQEDLYMNEAFDPYPEVLYENVTAMGEPKTEL